MAKIKNVAFGGRNTSKGPLTTHKSIVKPGFNMLDSATNKGRAMNKFSGKGEDISIKEGFTPESSVNFADQSAGTKPGQK